MIYSLKGILTHEIQVETNLINSSLLFLRIYICFSQNGSEPESGNRGAMDFCCLHITLCSERSQVNVLKRDVVI